MNQPLSDLRQKILAARKVTLPKHPRKPVPISPPKPSLYPKSTKMMYLEVKYKISIHKVIWDGSLDDVCKRFNYEVDRSTISRWRTHILKHVTIMEVHNNA